MNCNDLNQTLVNQARTQEAIASTLPPEAEEHLKICEPCRQLVGALSMPVGPASPSPATLRQIERRLMADLRPVRPIAPRPYLVAILIAAFVCVVGVGVNRVGASALAVMTPLQTGVILGALAISASLLANSIVNQMTPGSRRRIPPGLLPLGTTMCLAIAIAVLFEFQREQNFWVNGWACIRTGTSIGALAAVPLLLVLRRGAILSPAITGATTGLLAGLAGASALQIHCPNLDAWHILVAHLGVAVFGGVAGLLLGLAAENSEMIRQRP